MKERDDYHEWADTLAYDIERLVGVEIGEHSNLNSPWGNAHDAAEYELDKRARKPHEPQGWQPIETAPKGRNVLVAYQNKLGKWRIVRACYYEAGTLEAAEESDDFDEDGYASPGWREECETNDYIHQVEGEPLYWHPLPSAPVTKVKAP